MPCGKRTLVLAAVAILWFFVFASGAEANQKGTARKEQKATAARGTDNLPIATGHQLPAVQTPFPCGQTVYLAGAEGPPKELAQSPAPSSTSNTAGETQTAMTASAPVAPKVYALTIPPCDAKSAADFILRLRDGRLELAPAPKQNPVPGPAISATTMMLVAAVALLALAALLYFLIYSFFFPTVQRLITAEVKLRLREGAAQSTQASSDPGPALKTLAAQMAGQVMDAFQQGDFRKLVNRVERIENNLVRHQSEEPPRTLLPPNQRPTKVMDPPIVPVPKKSGYEEFLDAYNAARTDPSVRSQFVQRYKPKNLEVTNTTDVLRSSSRPLFDWKPDGDLLAVDAKNIDKTLWPDGHYYLVPGYDKRWVSDRMKGGCWDYFFDVNPGNGVTFVHSAAVVKQEGNLWQLADESNRGEIAWDPNASS